METKSEEIICDPRNNVIKYNFVLLFRFVFAIPIVTVLLCVILTMLLNLESIVTPCKVRGPIYLPSISSAIGEFKLQTYIWQYCISLHCSARIFVTIIFHKFYLSFPSVTNGVHLKVVSLTEFMENLCLLFLSIMSSSDNYRYKSCICSSLLHMVLRLYMIHKIQNDPGFHLSHRKSFKLRKVFWMLNLYFVVMAALSWNIYISICDKGSYNFFALFEYFAVLLIMAFHYVGFYEFQDAVVTIELNDHQKSRSKTA